MVTIIQPSKGVNQWIIVYKSVFVEVKYQKVDFFDECAPFKGKLPGNNSVKL